MEIPRCLTCGKISVNKRCIKCTYKLKGKKQIEVICVICGKHSTSTDKKWLTEDYKCRKCR